MLKLRLHLLLLALLISGVSFAQNHLDVRGRVTDKQNEPLIGVAVQIKDKSGGTMTDIDGNYVLSGVPEGSTLVFAYLGFKRKRSMRYQPRLMLSWSLTMNCLMKW